VARVAEATGVRLTVDGPCPGGEVGAAEVDLWLTVAEQELRPG
jgi:hypothetical protein